MVKTIYPKVYLINLMVEAAKTCKSFEVALGFQRATCVLTLGIISMTEEEEETCREEANKKLEELGLKEKE
jgi:hypothetical protein